MTDGKSPSSGLQTAVVCRTCRKVKFYSPAVAARRRYCDHVCYVARPTVTLAQKIINLLGGRHTLASLLRVNENTVKSWLQNGIPDRFHLNMLRLAKERGHLGEVTLERLQHTQAVGKAHRKEKKY